VEHEIFYINPENAWPFQRKSEQQLFYFVYVQVLYVPIIYCIYKRCASQVSLLKVILSKLIPHLITHYERPNNNYVRNNTNKSLF